MRVPFSLPYRKVPINEGRLSTVLHTFYVVVAYISSDQFLRVAFMSKSYDAVWLWPVYWLKYVPVQPALIVMSVSTVAFALASSIYIYSRALKFTALLFYFLMSAVSESFGSFSFGLIVTLHAGFCLGFIQHPRHRKTGDPSAGFYFFFAQLSLLLAYTLAGLWKIRGFINAAVQGQLSGIDPVTYQINSYRLQFMNFNGPGFHIPSALGYLLWAAVIFFEFGSGAVAFFPRYQRHWGAALFVMHAVALVTMNIFYFQHMLLIAVLLIANPYEPEPA